MVQNTKNLEERVVVIFRHKEKSNDSNLNYEINIPSLNLKKLAEIDYVQKALGKERKILADQKDEKSERAKLEEEIESLEQNKKSREASRERLEHYTKVFEKIVDNPIDENIAETLLDEYRNFWETVEISDAKIDPEDLLNDFKNMGKVFLYELNKKAGTQENKTLEGSVKKIFKKRNWDVDLNNTEILKTYRQKILYDLNIKRIKYENNLGEVDSKIHDSLKELIKRIYPNKYTEAVSNYILNNRILKHNNYKNDPHFKPYVEDLHNKLKKTKVNYSDIEEKIEELQTEKENLPAQKQRKRKTLSKKQKRAVILKTLYEHDQISKDIYDVLTRPDEELSQLGENHTHSFVVIKNNAMYSINALFNDDEQPIAQDPFVYKWEELVPKTPEGFFDMNHLTSGFVAESSIKSKYEDMVPRLGLFGKKDEKHYMVGFVRDSFLNK